MKTPQLETITVTLPCINTPYAVPNGIERWNRAIDQLHVFAGDNSGVLLCLRKGSDPQDVATHIWPLDASTTQHLIAVLQAACKQPD